MPPKPQIFKTPDGKEFTSKIEWRDYMFATFYSFKNKSNEPTPLIKKPGEIDGQMFDIADCDHVTIAIMDNVEQVQIDQLKNCKVMIGACASSIFIRNCENCVFYTCSRQLRLRDVTNCSFYIYSMSEVHIEFTNNVKFAPFNGGYPEHMVHLQRASLDVKQNLWYDIFDHNDPGKTHENWALIPEAEYQEPWYPAGQPCEHAIPITKAGSVPREPGDNKMQEFSFQQLVADANAIASTTTSPTKSAPPIAPTSTIAAAAPIPPPAPVVDIAVPEQTPHEKISSLISTYASYKAGDDISAIVSSTFVTVTPEGTKLGLADLSLLVSGQLFKIDWIKISSNIAVSSFSISSSGGGYVSALAMFELHNDSWKLEHVQRSQISDIVPK